MQQRSNELFSNLGIQRQYNSDFYLQKVEDMIKILKNWYKRLWRRKPLPILPDSFRDNPWRYYKNVYQIDLQDVKVR